MSNRKLYFKGSPELYDGQNSCYFENKEQLLEAIENFLENFTEAHDSGYTFSVDLVDMTEEEFNKLPVL